MERGECWLCGRIGPLTSEHLPPRSAGNRGTVEFQQASEEAAQQGRLEWLTTEYHRDGFTRYSLCLACNQRAGRRFVNSYNEFLYTVSTALFAPAPLVLPSGGQMRLSAPVGQQFKVKVKNPGLVARQIVQNFVSANGREFVVQNPWIKELLRSTNPMQLPTEVRLYVGAMKHRRTLISGGFGSLLPDGSSIFLSEVSHWPLATFLAFSRLDENRLTDITDWTTARKGDEMEVTLRINASCSNHPYDFRTPFELLLGEPRVATPNKTLQTLFEEIANRFGDRGAHRVAVSPGATK